MMACGITLLSIMDAGIKWLVERDISSIQIIVVRGWIISLGILITLMLVRKTGGVAALKTNRLKHHLMRSAVGVFAPALFFLSLKYIPLADAVAVSFSATFLMTIGSVIFLGERVGFHRWSAVFIGFIGVAIALRPGTSAFNPASLLVLCAAIAYASILISGRWMSKTESSLQLIFYFTFCNACICSVFTLITWPNFWRPLSVQEIFAIIGISAIALSGYFCVTRAFTNAPISAIAPIEYTALFWAVLFGYLVWGDIPDQWVWLGIVIILCAGLYIGYRESLQKFRVEEGKSDLNKKAPEAKQPQQ